VSNYTAPRADYPLMTRVRVREYGGDYNGTIVFAARWTAIGWEARVRPDGSGQKAAWVPASKVRELSAVELLAELVEGGRTKV
jgi:hypothetical protein